MAKKCAQCQKVIKGRSDKKFCDDACRTLYNNGRRRIESNTVRRINYILSNNRRILSELKGGQRATKCRRQELILRGFNFGHFTSLMENRKGQRCHFIYDQGYIILDEEWVRLIEPAQRIRRKKTAD